MDFRETRIEEICAAAFTKWGKHLQLVVAIEEMAELTKAISKFLRGDVHNHDFKNVSKHMIEEIADVCLMMEQMKHLFGRANVEAEFNQKLNRLEERISHDQVKK